MTCGSDKYCYSWNLDKSSAWKRGPNTVKTRRYASAVTIGNTVWLTGGRYAGRVTEKLTVNREIFFNMLLLQISKEKGIAHDLT